jgi:hypothetical protein
MSGLRRKKKRVCCSLSACPDCGGDVGVVEDAPSDASSDVDLPPLGGTSGDDYSD